MQVSFPIPHMLDHGTNWAVPYTYTGWVENGLRAALTGNTLGVLVGEQLNMTQQRALGSSEDSSAFLGCMWAGGHSPPLLHPGVLHLPHL